MRIVGDGDGEPIEIYEFDELSPEAQAFALAVTKRNERRNYFYCVEFESPRRAYVGKANKGMQDRQYHMHQGFWNFVTVEDHGHKWRVHPNLGKYSRWVSVPKTHTP